MPSCLKLEKESRFMTEMDILFKHKVGKPVIYFNLFILYYKTYTKPNPFPIYILKSF